MARIDRQRGLRNGAIAWLGIALLAFAAVLTSHPSNAFASTSTWSKPISLSGDKKVWAWFPAIAADPYGGIHVIWNGSTGVVPGLEKTTPVLRPSDDASWLFYTHWDGVRWSPPNEIAVTTPAGDAIRSAMVADPLGLLHLVYRGIRLDSIDPRAGEALRYSVAPVALAGQAQAWSPGVAFSRHFSTYYPDLAIDSRRTLHLIWTENDGASAYGIYYKRSSDGGDTWSRPVPLEDQSPVYYYRLQLKTGLNDELHAVWELVTPADAEAWAPTPIGFIYAHSSDGGTTWSQAAFLATPDPKRHNAAALGGLWPVQPAVGIDGRGQTLLVWRDLKSRVIYYQLSADGSSWSAPLPLPGVARGIERPFDRYDMVADSAGHVHLVAVAYPSGSDTLALLHSEWDGASWSAPDTITSAPPYPEWPRITTSEGNRLHVVWFDGDGEYDRTPIGVRYSTARASGPWVAPAPQPDVPMLTPTVTPPSSEVTLPQPSRAKLADLIWSQAGTSVQPNDHSVVTPDANQPLLFAAAASVFVLFIVIVPLYLRRARSR